MKRQLSPYYSGLLCLRLIEASDLETTLSWRNRDDARIWFKSSAPISLEQHRAWFQSYQDKDDDFLFIVEVNGKPVGQASVYGIQWDTGSAEVGRFLVAPEASGWGYISHACGALLQLSRETLGLKSLFLEVFETNERAIRLYQRNGFAEECRCSGLIRMMHSLGSDEKV
jgi:diamine N-acetyltransferase